MDGHGPGRAGGGTGRDRDGPRRGSGGRGPRHRPGGQCGRRRGGAGFVEHGRGAGLCRHEPAGAQYRCRAGSSTRAGPGLPIRTTPAVHGRQGGARRRPPSPPGAGARYRPRGGPRGGHRRNAAGHGAPERTAWPRAAPRTATADCAGRSRRAATCGSVRYCVGGGCETVEPEAGDGFVEATTKLNMVMELGGDEFDRGNLRFFNGPAARLHHPLGRARELLQELRAAGGTGQLQPQGGRARAGTQPGPHALPRAVLCQARPRDLHPPGPGVVRLRLEAWAHLPAAGPRPARDRMGEAAGGSRWPSSTGSISTRWT